MAEGGARPDIMSTLAAVLINAIKIAVGRLPFPGRKQQDHHTTLLSCHETDPLLW